MRFDSIRRFTIRRTAIIATLLVLCCSSIVAIYWRSATNASRSDTSNLFGAEVWNKEKTNISLPLNATPQQLEAELQVHRRSFLSKQLIASFRARKLTQSRFSELTKHEQTALLEALILGLSDTSAVPVTLSDAEKKLRDSKISLRQQSSGHYAIDISGSQIIHSFCTDVF